MEKRFAKEFTRPQCESAHAKQESCPHRKRFAEAKEKTASREVSAPVFATRIERRRSRVSKAPCLFCIREMNSRLVWRHLFCSVVIGLAEFIRESFNEMNSPPAEHGRWPLSAHTAISAVQPECGESQALLVLNEPLRNKPTPLCAFDDFSYNFAGRTSSSAQTKIAFFFHPLFRSAP